jgi:hypothetical protein
VQFALSASAENRLVGVIKLAAEHAGLNWKETNYLALRRGPYVIGAGLDESIEAETRKFEGRFVNLFDSELRVQRSIELKAGTRVFLLDLDTVNTSSPRLLAAACKALPIRRDDDASLAWTVEGVADTPGIVLISTAKPPRSILLEQKPLDSFTYDTAEGLLTIRFPNEARPRELVVEF